MFLNEKTFLNKQKEKTNRIKKNEKFRLSLKSI